MPFCCFKAFLKKFIENFSFRHKMTISKRALKYSEIYFSYHFWKGKILRKIWFCLNYCFGSNQLSGINIKKKIFLHKVSHILLNYAFLLFWSIFVEIHRVLFFLDKRGYLRNEHWNTQKVFFYHVWNGVNPEENLDLFKQLFLI